MSGENSHIYEAIESSNSSEQIKSQTAEYLQEAEKLKNLHPNNEDITNEYEEVRLAVVAAMSDVALHARTDLQSFRMQLDTPGNGSITREELRHLKNELQDLQRESSNIKVDYSDLPPGLFRKDYRKFSTEEAQVALTALQKNYKLYAGNGLGSSTFTDYTLKQVGNKKEARILQEKLIDSIYDDGVFERGYTYDGLLVGFASDEGGNFLRPISAFESQLRQDQDINALMFANYVEHHGDDALVCHLLDITQNRSNGTKAIFDLMNQSGTPKIVEIKKRLSQKGFFNAEGKICATKADLGNTISQDNLPRLTLACTDTYVDSSNLTFSPSDVDVEGTGDQDCTKLHPQLSDPITESRGIDFTNKCDHLAGTLSFYIQTSPCGKVPGLNEIIEKHSGSLGSEEFRDEINTCIQKFNTSADIPCPELTEEFMDNLKDLVQSCEQVPIAGVYNDKVECLKKLGGALDGALLSFTKQSEVIEAHVIYMKDQMKNNGADVATLANVFGCLGKLQDSAKKNVRNCVERDFQQINSPTSSELADESNPINSPEIGQFVYLSKQAEFNRDLEANLDEVEPLKIAKKAGLLYIAEEIIGKDIEPDREKRMKMAEEIQNELLELVKANPGDINNFQMLGELLRSKGLENTSGAFLVYKQTLQTLTSKNNYARALALEERARELKRAEEVRREREELERLAQKAQDAREKVQLETERAALIAKEEDIQTNVAALDSIVERATEEITELTSESVILQNPEVQEVAEQVIASYASEAPDPETQSQLMENLISVSEETQKSIGYKIIISEFEEQYTALAAALEENDTDTAEKIIQTETATADTTLALSSLGLLEQSGIPKEDVDHLQEALIVTIDESLHSPDVATSERVAYAVDTFISENPDSEISQQIIESYSQGIIAAQELGEEVPALISPTVQKYIIFTQHESLAEDLQELPGFTDTQFASISPKEIQTITESKEAKEGFIHFYETCHSLNLVELWGFRHVVSPCLSEVHGQAFSLLDGDYMGENELNIFLSSCLYATTGDRRMKHPQYLSSTMQVARNLNKTNGLTTTEEVNQFGDSPVEALFREQFAPRGNMFEFKKAAFLTALKV